MSLMFKHSWLVSLSLLYSQAAPRFLASGKDERMNLFNNDFPPPFHPLWPHSATDKE